METRPPVTRRPRASLKEASITGSAAARASESARAGPGRAPAACGSADTLGGPPGGLSGVTAAAARAAAPGPAAATSLCVVTSHGESVAALATVTVGSH